MKLRMLAVLGLVLVMAGCYKTTVNTGLTPGSDTIEKPWAHSFVAGLVPIETINAASECPNGVARVETQHTFLNMVAYIATGGIYSPMSITVTCARGNMEEAAVIDVDVEDTDAVARAIQDAAVRSWDSGEAVFLRTSM